MKSIISVLTLTAFLLMLSVGVFAQGSSTPAPANQGGASPDTTEAGESKAHEKAEEKGETKTQEKAEEKTEAKGHHRAHMAPVDINSASKEDLMKVKGVTDEIAEKIMAKKEKAATK